uniref:Nuclear receptor domain-containing protein n=1 Tax=Heterorhabditis bacteriophora TaxID=37862 RepID=A0A1I7WU31_HETBA
MTSRIDKIDNGAGERAIMLYYFCPKILPIKTISYVFTILFNYSCYLISITFAIAFQSLETLSMYDFMPPTTKQPCSVCGEQGDGAHFGAEACRACAAFFRRSVALAKTYTCRNSGSCNIQSRSVECDSNNHFKAEPECPTMDFNFISEEQGMPILMKLKVNYTKLDNVRRVIHNREGDSVFSVRLKKFISIVVVPKNKFFGEIKIIQPRMLPNFAHEHRENANEVVQTGRTSLFAPSFEIYRRNILDPMRSGKTTYYEFFALCSLVLWDHVSNNNNNNNNNNKEPLLMNVNFRSSFVCGNRVKREWEDSLDGL